MISKEVKFKTSTGKGGSPNLTHDFRGLVPPQIEGSCHKSEINFNDQVLLDDGAPSKSSYSLSKEGMKVYKGEDGHEQLVSKHDHSPQIQPSFSSIDDFDDA